ncbi:MAG: molybdopterin molybdotransferase MoeA [Candidatus Bathyarchaeota archaeon]|nr:MAG: molybdopterin molybdotransferase MoeA [Candidatus Bathyarchaeota archaeon]
MVRLKGFDKLSSVDEALSIFHCQLKLDRMSSTWIPTIRALGQVVADDIFAGSDLPPFDRSAVDGYALRAHDTFGASQFNPRILKLTRNDKLGENQAREIWTGNPLPEGADAVVMLEHTRLKTSGLEVWVPVTPGRNVSKQGEDVRNGDLAIQSGTRLKPHHMGLLAALGLTRVSVVEKPRIAILSTGNEIVELGHKPGFGQVVGVNRIIISCLCQELGADSVDLGIVKDDSDEIAEKVRGALERTEMLVTTGGTSVGHADVVPATVNKVGAPGVVVHGIAMRPGMPTALAILKGKPVVILPGNPVAAFFGFEVFARPLIHQMLGIRYEPRPTIVVKMTEKAPSALGRRVFLRVRVSQRKGEYFAEPIRIKGAGILSTMTQANGYVIIPEVCEGLEKGESIKAHLFDKVEGEKHV